MALSDNLVRQRLKHRYTQDHVAGEIGVKQPVYARWESGKTPMPKKRRKLAADFYKISLEELETGIAPEEKKSPPGRAVHELCKKIAALKDTKDLSKDLIVDLLKAGADWLGMGR